MEVSDFDGLGSTIPQKKDKLTVRAFCEQGTRAGTCTKEAVGLGVSLHRTWCTEGPAADHPPGQMGQDVWVDRRGLPK